MGEFPLWFQSRHPDGMPSQLEDPERREFGRFKLSNGEAITAAMFMLVEKGKEIKIYSGKILILNSFKKDF